MCKIICHDCGKDWPLSQPTPTEVYDHLRTAHVITELFSKHYYVSYEEEEIKELIKKTQKHHDNGDGFSYLGLPKFKESSRKDLPRSIPCFCFECNSISEHQLVEINTKTNEVKVYCLLENHLIHTFSNPDGFYRWRLRRDK